MAHKRKHKKTWKLCPSCFEMIYAVGLGNHLCPEKVEAKKVAELNMVIDEELASWEEEVRDFWKSKDVKFMQYMLDQEKDE